MRRVGILLKSQIRDELRAEARPVDLRITGQMGVVVAYRAVHLAQQRHGFDAPQLAPEARGAVGDFFTQGARAGRLPVGAREHGPLGERARPGFQVVKEFVQGGQQGAAQAIAEHQRMGEIVDVLGSAGEMYELCDGRQFALAAKALLDEILHGFDIVPGGFFDALDRRGVVDGKTLGDGCEFVERGGGQRGDLGDAAVAGQGEQPAHLDQHTAPDQAVLAEHLREMAGFVRVATVQGGNGGQRAEREHVVKHSVLPRGSHHT